MEEDSDFDSDGPIAREKWHPKYILLQVADALHLKVNALYFTNRMMLTILYIFSYSLSFYYKILYFMYKS